MEVRSFRLFVSFLGERQTDGSTAVPLQQYADVDSKYQTHHFKALTSSADEDDEGKQLNTHNFVDPQAANTLLSTFS